MWKVGPLATPSPSPISVLCTLTPSSSSARPTTLATRLRSRAWAVVTPDSSPEPLARLARDSAASCSGAGASVDTSRLTTPLACCRRCCWAWRWA